MTAKEVATQLVDLCKKGEFLEAVETLYADNVVSAEPMAMGAMPAETRGLKDVLGKGKWWMSNHEIHSMTTTGPFIHQEKFSVVFEMDVTSKQDGKRHKGTEIGVYTVVDGKVAREEFYYGI